MSAIKARSARKDKNVVAHRLGQLADLARAEIKGDSELTIHSLSPIDAASAGDLTFIVDDKYIKYLKTTPASAIILSSAHERFAPSGATLLVSANPYLSYALVSAAFKRPSDFATGQLGAHPSAAIAPDASLGADCHIGPGAVIGAQSVLGDACVIGANAVIGERCVLQSHCVLDAGVVIGSDSQLGRAVRVSSGAVIGSDGFGYAQDGERWVKIEQCGRVVIGDDVEIGANTTIDCGALGDTVIKRGVIIDNQVQVAHNVLIGEDTAIAGGSLIAGSTEIGRRCRIGGGCAISGHLKIADDVTLLGKTTVSRSIRKKGAYASSLPTMDRATWHKNIVWFRNLHRVLHSAGFKLR